MTTTRLESGETLTETLAALLIGTVAIVALVGAVVGSAHINAQAQQKSVELWGSPSADGTSDYGELGDAESESGSFGNGQITIKRQDNSQSQNFNVDYFGGDDVVSYVYQGD